MVMERVYQNYVFFLIPKSYSTKMKMKWVISVVLQSTYELAYLLLFLLSLTLRFNI